MLRAIIFANPFQLLPQVLSASIDLGHLGVRRIWESDSPGESGVLGSWVYM